VDLHVPAGATALDRQLQQYVRTTAPRGRDTAQIGPFLATFHPTDPLPYLSYAIPDDDARPGAADVAALVAAYERHDRLPRLEFLPGAAPAVEAALLHAGFVVEARLPAMVCTPQQLVVPTLDAGLVLAVPAGDADLHAMTAAQHAAFGEGPPDADSVARSRKMLDAGGLAILARERASGEVVGGGVATVPGDGVTEIAGIGVLEAHRRRGIATAITARLTADAFAAGVTTAFLTPGDDGAHRAYRRAGFADATVMLHISRPASDDADEDARGADAATE
jgi:ribosomal protein S18 acetylase RimI-like enzyme